MILADPILTTMIVKDFPMPSFFHIYQLASAFYHKSLPSSPIYLCVVLLSVWINEFLFFPQWFIIHYCTWIFWCSNCLRVGKWLLVLVTCTHHLFQHFHTTWHNKMFQNHLPCPSLESSIFPGCLILSVGNGIRD